MSLKGIFYTYVILLLSALGANAQHTDTAQAAFAVKEHEYEKAIALYKKAVAENPADIQLTEKLGAAYMASGDYKNAELIYQKLAADPKADKTDKFYYAQALRNNDKYDLAEKEYLEFALAMPNDQRAQEFMYFGDVLPELLLDRGAYEITDIPENSSASDIGPVFCLADICFSSNRGASGTVQHLDAMSGKGFYDLYLLPGGSNPKAELPEKLKGDINGKLNEGPATFSHDGQEVIFTRTNYKDIASDGTYKLGLYHADYDSVKHKWVNIEPLNIINYNYNMAHPTLSKDGNRLFFVSDMPGGYGQMDIYLSEKKNGQWGSPVNLGKGVNTPGNELYPFISDKGTLFFSSDSRIGLGGLDIYSATYTGTQWGDVRNLGAPFNTNSDDFGFICDEPQLTGYFVSNRPGGKGSDDIYKFVKKTQNICGQVLDATTQEPVPDAAIDFISVGGDNAQATSNKTGQFCVALEPGLGYFIKALAPGYSKYEAMMSVSLTDNPALLFAMQAKGGIALTVDVTKDNHPLANALVKLLNINSGETEEQNSNTGGTVKFDIMPKQFYNITVVGNADGPEPYKESSRNISTAGKKLHDSITVTTQCEANTLVSASGFPYLFFNTNSADIPPEANRNLDNIVKEMLANPIWGLEIRAYSDWNGSEQNNPDLATRRATACLDYIAAHGIDKKRLTAIGYGDKSARGNQTLPSGQNRRAEFKIIKPE